MRDYDGFTFSYESLLTTLYRVTKEGGVVVWVVGDQTHKFCESLTSFKQALYAVEDVGFKLLDTMAFVKQNYAPAYPTMSRYAQVFEYMFVFVKGYKPKTFNPVRIPVAENTKKRKKYGGFKYRKKDGSYTEPKKIENIKDTKKVSNVWRLPTGVNSTEHPAVFPIELARRHIETWSNVGDLVLDPMCGSGTTCVVAKQTGRSYIGIDCSEKYCDISQQRLAFS